MRQLDVTDDQHAYLERVRATLESEYLGPYGEVDVLDALQYLIDVHEATDPEMPTTDASVVDAATGDEPPATGRATPDQAEEERPAVEADPSATGDLDVDVTDDAVTGTEDVDDPDGDEDPTDEATTDTDAVDTTDTDVTDGTTGGSEADDADGSAEDDASPTPAGGGNDRLQAMMNLLDTHGEKWREGDGEARYEVDLPDGTVESVQTRDDVRAVLFKNYR